MTLPQQLSILQAALEGKRIDRQPVAANVLWCEVTTPQTHHFAFNDYNYRLAPTLRKTREWLLDLVGGSRSCSYGSKINDIAGWHAYDMVCKHVVSHLAIHVREVLEGEAAPSAATPQRQTFEQWWQGLEPKCIGQPGNEHVRGLRPFSGGETGSTYRDEALAVWRAAGGAE